MIITIALLILISSPTIAYYVGKLHGYDEGLKDARKAFDEVFKR